LRLILFLLFVLVPAAEIAVFILIGGIIGVLPTLAIILLTAVIGSILLRRQGTEVLRRIRREIEADRVPGADLVHGAMILVAGVLLLTPGLVTDTLGFLLFIPALRTRIWRGLKARVDTVVVSTAQRRRYAGGPVIDLDDDDYAPKDDDSPWRPGRDPTALPR
jgi:UPF0716 protein FxsA